MDYPDKAISELRRVLKDGGLLLLSTVGFFPWHPYPQDDWRWTQTGIKKIFERGGFEDIEVYATRGTISGIFFLLAHYAYSWSNKNFITRLFKNSLVSMINFLGEYFDKKNQSLADITTHITAIPEFFCVVKK